MHIFKNILFCLVLLGLHQSVAAEDSLFPVEDALITLGKKEYKTCSGNHWKPNADMPPRNPSGRIHVNKFFEQYADKDLEISELGVVPNANFGEYKPGDQFGNSWIVRAKGVPVGISHKTAPWVTAYIECRDENGLARVIHIKPVRGCGCGGTSDWNWTVPFSAPSGNHKVIITWEHPKLTKQKLRREYDVRIVNTVGKSNVDYELAGLEKENGKERVLVFQNGAIINNESYYGVDDMSLSFGGYEGARSNVITPSAPTVDIGYWIVNKKASFYSRGLFRFDLESIKGKKVKSAILKLSIKQNQKYLPPVLKQSFPVYAMKKTWKEGVVREIRGKSDGRYFVDGRGLSKGHPNVYYQAWPTKWEKDLASGESDRSEQVAELVIDPKQLKMPGARADLTALVNSWLSGEVENHGILIGKDLPKELHAVHPGLDNKVEEYKKLYNGGAVPFVSSDEASDLAYSPRLIVVLE